MAQQAEKRKAEIIDAVAQAVPGELAEFARVFYAGLAPNDLVTHGLDGLVAGVKSIWDFAATRTPGTAKLRVFRPGAGTKAFGSATAIAEIVNDDMPFLVDSVSAALSRHDLTAELIIHPVLRVARNGSGALTGLGSGEAESIMQLWLTGTVDDADLAAAEASLTAALNDVRSAVQDWRAMLHRLSLVTAELDDPALAKSPVPAEEVAEAKAFLHWLGDNRFTFLGYREYLFETKGKQSVMRVPEDSGLGILRDPAVSIFDGVRDLAALPPDVRAFLESPTLLMATKANQRATVHRPVHMDVIGVKKLDASGKVVAERRFVGLFTSSAYNQSATEIPVLRRKLASVIRRAGLSPTSHDGKALIQILETFPRDELFQIGEDELFETAMGILQLQDRKRIALFLRRDPFERFVSLLIYIPRERYDQALREKFHALISEALGGRISASYIQLSEAPLARLHIIVKTQPGAMPDVDVAALEARLIEAGRGWPEQFHAALMRAEAAGRPTASGNAYRRFQSAFPIAYRERFSADDAVEDMPRIERALAGETVFWLYRKPGGAEGDAGTDLAFRIFQKGQPVALSDVLPMLENRGLRVISEVPFKLNVADSDGPVWLHDFDLSLPASMTGDAITAARERFHDAFRATWTGAAEDDGFNRLVLAAGLDWREIAVLRAYAKYLKQAGFTYSQSLIEQTLAKHAGIAATLIALFHARFNPDRADSTKARGLAVEIEHALDAVTVLDEDRILRRYVNLILATLRTNVFQPDAAGNPKPYMSFKLESGRIDDLPKPRPHYEVWVYSPDVEAIHLRGGKVARGGIRWSDRREDFRTEILGLLKAQTVKNAVIVPVGSKGGFVVKRPPTPDAGRAALQAQVVACYSTMMNGLLDITDNRKGSDIVPPTRVVRHDPDDPYLVVAADKGTATFSDIANGISQRYGFWLDDAFASGGSAGYDHKALGITARGAWVAVERHFREAGIDLRRDEITCIGIGDMSGDVFGNGMLHSNKIRLIGAFNHLHIFIDPAPDAARSYEERKRLFTTPGTSWMDYDKALIAKGGGVFDRSAKSIELTPEIKALFGLDRDRIAPSDLIQAMLKAPVDLLWFGGIGTYIKAGDESHADAGDRANDALRVDARDVRARVIGEGANLGVTQRGRIEYGLNGGRINTDAIDNSAGVDCSDHEVNIKILLGDPDIRAELDLKQRDALLASMADEVCHLVLRDNYLQTFALSAAIHQGPDYIDIARRQMHRLEREVALDRALEALPTDAQMEARRAAGLSMARPELAVVLAWSKIALYNALLPSATPDDPALVADLSSYFPTPLRDRFAGPIQRHGLRREIIATVLTNEMLNRGGLTLAADLEEETGASAAQLVRAYCILRDALGLPAVWAGIEALDATLNTRLQLDLYRTVQKALEASIRWLVRQPAPLGQGSIAEAVAKLTPALATLSGGTAAPEDPALAAALAEAPAELAAALRKVITATSSLDVLALADGTGASMDRAAAVYFRLGARLHLDWLRAQVQTLPTPDGWSRQAARGLAEDIARHQDALARRVLADGGDADAWLTARGEAATRIETLVAEAHAAGTLDLARLSVIERSLRGVLTA